MSGNGGCGKKRGCLTVKCLECNAPVELAVHHNERGYYIGYKCECGWRWRRSERFRLEKEAELELEVLKLDKSRWEVADDATR